ncbi:hypothetical protein VCB98_07020 [Gammaproteobacteria bacterium AB-CW1]|uniref:Uncharacterized protein n=1 Tax=Natronospira elongata TaxID=3110268 RepID=A0AAP6JFA7_9GAMM|nr:hypothetical protein [Gammaproteobacteria bacterium AB-CW1]
MLFYILRVIALAVPLCFVVLVLMHVTISGVAMQASITDVVSTLAAVFGLLFAVVAYFLWHRDKIREDTFEAIRKYLRAIASAEDVKRAIELNYRQLVPEPGSVPIENEAIVKELIQKSYRLQEGRSEAMHDLNVANREMGFWGIKLTKAFEEKHGELLKELRNAATIMTGLNSQLSRFYLHEVSSLDEVQREKAMIDERFRSAARILESRISMGLSGIVQFGGLR